MSHSVRPHRRQPTRLPRPWGSPGKNTGVGCHFLLQCMKVKSESEVVQSCQTGSDPMDCSLPGSSIHGICQASVLEWGAIAFFGEPRHFHPYHCSLYPEQASYLRNEFREEPNKGQKMVSPVSHCAWTFSLQFLDAGPQSPYPSRIPHSSGSPFQSNLFQGA